jgi:hypothetical protein
VRVIFQMNANPLSPLRALGLLLLICVGACGAQGDDRVVDSEAEFQTYVIDYLKTSGLVPGAERGEDDLVIVSDDLQLGLHNVNIKCELAGGTRAACQSVLEEHFGGILKRMAEQKDRKDPTLAEATPQLRLQFTTEDYAHSAPDGMLWTQWAPGVLKAVVLDSPDSFTYINRRHTEAWQVSEEEIWALAEREFARTIDYSAFDEPSTSNEHMLLFAPEDGYAAARILVPEFRARAAAKLGEPFFAALPHRDVLLLWSGDADPVLMSRIKQQVAEDYESSPYALSRAVFKVSKDGVSSLEP